MKTEQTISRSAPLARHGAGPFLWYALLLVLSAMMLFPFFYMLLTAVKSESQLITHPFLPEVWLWQNFGKAWNSEPFTRFLFNTVGVAIATTLLALLFCSLGGFAFAHYSFLGRRMLFLGILGTMMVPSQVTMIPNFLTTARLGWLNSYAGLIIPVLPMAFGIFLMRQFFANLPKDLFEAARMDGAGEFRVYFQIALPLCKPALAALALFTFMGSWNSFLWPLVILDSEKYYTLPVGLLRFAQQYDTNYPYLMAVSLLTLLPQLGLFLVFQRAFVRGMALSGIKE